ncbi:MAG TPA: transcriptional regulator [Isosphaeraceae bacterium]|nr:transcriptional regulator [Isosphaeraceae bacterium]
MSFSGILLATGWLIRDTFRQALASRVFWLMLGVSVLCIVFCSSAHIVGGRPLRTAEDIELYGGDDKPLTGPNPKPGQLTLAFGAVRLGLFRDGAAEVHFLLVLLAKWVAGAAGTLIALVWTAGFLPEFLQPSAAAVLLAKPVPRSVLLFGKYLGVLVFVTVQATVFVVGTWLALGLCTGIWQHGYLLSLPLLVLHFAIVYSISLLIAVCTRNTVACAFGSIMFWFICFAMNYGRHAAVARPRLAPGLAPFPPLFRNMIEAGYWLLPKPADLVILLDRALQADAHFFVQPEFAAVQAMHAFHPALSVLTSALFAAAVLAIAARELATTDY